VLNNLFQFLNQNSGALTVIFTAVVTISTLVYAILTAVLVNETKKMREVQTEPKIEITLRPLESVIHLVRLHIKNIGLGPAENIKLTPSVISGNNASELLAEFTESSFFETGLKYLGPGQEIYSRFTQLTQNQEHKLQSVFLFEIEYKSATGKKYCEKKVIDMSEMKGYYQLGKPNLYSIAKSLEKIQNDIGRISSGYKRIKADIFTNEDREREYRDHKQLIEEMNSNNKNYL